MPRKAVRIEATERQLEILRTLSVSRSEPGGFVQRAKVIVLAIEGLTNKQMAAQLHLTLRAIEDRRARLMRHLGVRSVAELLQLVQQAQVAS